MLTGLTMKKPFVVPVEKLGEEPYLSLVCYPKSCKAEFEARLKELRKLGVKALQFTGERNLFNIPVLGKGCVGIVTLALINSGKAALKIRRVDAHRLQMRHEAEMLGKANSVNVGPKLLRASENFVLMQYVEGDLLPTWLKKSPATVKVRNVLCSILRQCWRLDNVGLDHGELSNAPKHIIVDVDDQPHLVDFETASINRRVSNVTSVCQYLFLRSQIAEKVKEKLGKM